MHHSGLINVSNPGTPSLVDLVRNDTEFLETYCTAVGVTDTEPQHAPKQGRLRGAEQAGADPELKEAAECKQKTNITKDAPRQSEPFDHFSSRHNRKRRMMLCGEVDPLRILITQNPQIVLGHRPG